MPSHGRGEDLKEKNRGDKGKLNLSTGEVDEKCHLMNISLQDELLSSGGDAKGSPEGDLCSEETRNSDIL